MKNVVTLVTLRAAMKRELRRRRNLENVKKGGFGLKQQFKLREEESRLAKIWSASNLNSRSCVEGW